jgi:RNA polymerase sigma factor (sigma-70 family)
MPALLRAKRRTDQCPGTKREKIMTAEAGQVCDDPSVTGLVTRARNGDQEAWDALVERYAPLIWSICRRYRLSRADASDVGQSVWLHLLAHLGKIREPAALPGWLATTTRRECGRLLRAARGRHCAATQVPDTGNIPDNLAWTQEQVLLAAERHAALHEAFLQLSERDQQLIALLIQDPSVPYVEISVRMNIPIGSIGPHRHRCLEKLRRHPAMAALIDKKADTVADQMYA